MIRFDWHVHSALSGCAENTMSPRRILERARAARLDSLAITDHNASAHAVLCFRLAAEYGITLVPGVEVSSREEVHVLALFMSLEAVTDFQALLDAALPGQANLAEVFGHQVVYNERDEVVDVDDRLRQVGVKIGLEQLLTEIHDRGGAAVPAHVFRARNSLMSQLGSIDAGAAYDALQLGARSWRQKGLRVGDCVQGFPAFPASDAHFLDDVGRVAAELTAPGPGLQALMGALRKGAHE